MLSIYKKIFIEALTKNLITQNSENFFLSIALISGNSEINLFIVFFLHFIGFFLANLFNFFFGFMISKLSLKKEKNKKSEEFASFFYNFGYLIILSATVFLNYGYIGSISSMFLGYSFSLLKIFSNKNQVIKFLIFFSFSLFFAKLLNIYLIIKFKS